MTTQENLLRLMNLPIGTFAGVCRTADGYYLARKHGDLGYNAFLGRPAAPHAGPGREHTLHVWHSLSPVEQIAVIQLAANPVDGAPILLEQDFGVPVWETLT
jgi:hypothetical protein